MLKRLNLNIKRLPFFSVRKSAAILITRPSTFHFALGNHNSKNILENLFRKYVIFIQYSRRKLKCTIGRCLKVISECIKPYYVRLVRLVSDKMNSSTDQSELEELISREIEMISATSFETYARELKPCDGDICNDF